MKFSLLTLCSVLALTSTAMAYTSKTETQMQTECATKWKSDGAKVKSCINGKKGYQAKMTKSGATSKTSVKESHTVTKKMPMTDHSKMIGKTSSETTVDTTKKTETMKKM